MTSFIENLATIHGFPEQGVSLPVTPEGILRAFHDQVYGKLRVELIEHIQGFAKTAAFERKQDEQVDIGVFPGPAMGMGAEKDDFFRLKVPGDLFCQPLNVFRLDHQYSLVRHGSLAGKRGLLNSEMV